MANSLKTNTLVDSVPNCSGCGTCANVCSQDAIYFKEDSNGFRYPYIDEAKCLGCNSCVRICPNLQAEKKHEEPTKPLSCYAAWILDEHILSRSSSGGIFSALALHILAKGGVVYGAAITEGLVNRHIRIDNADDLEKLRGSKYIPSDVGYTYRQVKEDLKAGIPVLFSGTPCQVLGLKTFLKKDDPLLLCVDIICHGTPAPALFREYVHLQESLHDNHKVNMVRFRDKRLGWRRFGMELKFEGVSEPYAEALDRDLFMKGFLSNICLRTSCYKCTARVERKRADFTLCDFWGVWTEFPDIAHDKGISGVFVHSQKAQTVWGDIQNYVFSKEVEFESIFRHNPSYSENLPIHRNFSKFTKNIGKTPIDKLVYSCARTPLYLRFLGKIKRAIKKYILRRK